MLLKLCVALTAMGVFCIPKIQAQEKADKTAGQARMVSEQFGKALLARDLDSAMKLVAVPSYTGASLQEGGVVTRKLDDVGKQLADYLQNIPPGTKGSVEFSSLQTYEEVLKQQGDKINPANRKLLDEVLQKNDRLAVIFLYVTMTKGRKLYLVVMIGQRDGQPKVVGHYSKGELVQFCHPGCFPAGTLIETPKGTKPVECIRVGEPIITVRPDGACVPCTVKSVFVTRNHLVKVETETGNVLTTGNSLKNTTALPSRGTASGPPRAAAPAD